MNKYIYPTRAYLIFEDTLKFKVEPVEAHVLSYLLPKNYESLRGVRLMGFEPT
jgi:hypothetical protein